MESNKRKERLHDNGTIASRISKKQKRGSGGKWQTPHQQAKKASLRAHGTIEPGDVGIWATCARGQEGKATVELRSMLQRFAEKFYGISEGEEEDDQDLDIEDCIQKETMAIEHQAEKSELFSPIRLDIECVLFVKLRPPIDPVDFVHRICKELASKPETAQTRYINRLTPMTLIGKATDKGLEDVAKVVLGECFELTGKESPEAVRGAQTDGTQGRVGPTNYSYAIRPTIRNHNTLTRDVVIKKIASSIADVHKVNLTKPDKVILVEIYQTVCGVSVVGDDWEVMKRYNIAELSRSIPVDSPKPSA